MEAVWIALGGNAAFLAVVAFLGTRIVKHWLEKDLDTFKHNLERTASLELERLRGSLTIAASEHSILLSRLQDKRARLIGEIYEKLARSISTTRLFVLDTQWVGEEATTDQKSGAAYEALVDLRDYFDQRRVWLPEECCAKIADLIEELRKIYMGYSLELRLSQSGGARDMAKWQGLWEAVDKDAVPKARQALEAELRRLLEPARGKGLVL